MTRVVVRKCEYNECRSVATLHANCCEKPFAYYCQFHGRLVRKILRHNAGQRGRRKIEEMARCDEELAVVKRAGGASGRDAPIRGVIRAGHTLAERRNSLPLRRSFR